MSDMPPSSAKPSSPPPAYTELADPQLSSPYQSAGTSHILAQTPLPTHAGYGPTPIAQQTQLLPYYDPRSPYAIAEAAARARWRFIGAILWALGILVFVSCLTGWEVHASTVDGTGLFLNGLVSLAVW